MRACIVGNGPSAKDQGGKIDACDLVVRLKCWWAHGAENAGRKIDAWAWFGQEETLIQPVPKMNCEHWYTLCLKQEREWKDWEDKFSAFVRYSQGLPTRRLWDDLWVRCFDYLDRAPTTGFVALAMALEIYKPEELLLVGFDSTTPDQPNYDCARVAWSKKSCHDFAAEKLAMAEIGDGGWLGEPIGTQLEWIGDPINA